MDGLMSSENQEGNVQQSRLKKQGQKLSPIRKGALTAGAVAFGVGSLMVGPENKARAQGPDVTPTPVTTTVKPEGPRPTPTPDAIARQHLKELEDRLKREAEEKQKKEEQGERLTPTGITPVRVATAVIEQPLQPTQPPKPNSSEDEDSQLKKNLFLRLVSLFYFAALFLGTRLIYKIRDKIIHRKLNTNIPDINIMPRKKKFGIF